MTADLNWLAAVTEASCLQVSCAGIMDNLIHTKYNCHTKNNNRNLENIF